MTQMNYNVSNDTWLHGEKFDDLPLTKTYNIISYYWILLAIFH